MSPKAVAMRKIIIPTKHAVGEFVARTVSMSSMDYDLDEILGSVVGALAGAENTQPAIDKCKSYLSYGGWKGEPTQDGEILSRAMEDLVMSLETTMVKMGILTPFGILRGSYSGHIGYDIIFLEKD